MNKNLFNTVPVDKPKRNVFDLSHDLKFSFNMGELIPTTIIDCVPGDTFNIGFENMLRFSALLAPIMHRIKVTTHYFFVPNRIVWPNWEKWITGELDVEPPYIVPNNSDPMIPRYGVNNGSLLDYMGIPTYNYEAGTIKSEFQISALPIAAYWKIYHEYYMDQNNDADFQNFEEYYTLFDGDNSTNSVPDSFFYTQLAFDCSTRIGDRAWMHDYFTSALPWAQKGEDVFIPLSEMPVAPRYVDGEGVPRESLTVRTTANDTPVASSSLSVSASSLMQTSSGLSWLDGQYASNDGGTGDGTINNLRRAFALQSWLEKNARGGTRYTESILMHFGVQSSDKRLQRPEYLGGSVQNMVISEVLSTAETLNSTDQVVNPVGQLSGHGISVGGSKVLRYYCEEHGWIIGLISVMPDTAYFEGIPRKFTRTDRFEYFWGSFQHIGEQEIKYKELLANPQRENVDDPIGNGNEETFGYVPRYSEYKFENSRVAGDFRNTLDFWHLARKFRLDSQPWEDTQAPPLTAEFIYPLRFGIPSGTYSFDRIFAVPSTEQDTIYAHVLNKIKAVRPMARYGIPSI